MILVNELFSYPFLSDVWGSFSDVATLVVTLIGTLYIIRTFRNQKLINEEQASINAQQSRLNHLAMEKDRREIRPYFKIEATTISDEGLSVIVTIRLDHALAFDVLFDYYKGGRYKVTQNVLLQSEWELDNKMGIKIEHSQDENAEEGSISVATIKFKDENGQAYRQEISFDNRAHITVPRRVEDYSIWQVGPP